MPEGVHVDYPRDWTACGCFTLRTEASMDAIGQFKENQKKAWSTFAPTESVTGTAAPKLVKFSGVKAGATVLDVGCGTGNLLAEVAARHPGVRFVGIDPSEALLRKARARADLSGARLLAGGVESMPFADGGFSHTLSMLVLQEFTDRERAIAEMRRVTGAGGIIAACQWDFAKMPVIDALVEAITEVDPVGGARLDRRSSPVFNDEGELVESWVRGGLADVTAGRIMVERTFAGFDRVWLPLLAGSTPSTLALAALSAAPQARVRTLMMRRFGVVDVGAAMTLRAEALVVRGTAVA